MSVVIRIEWLGGNVGVPSIEAGRYVVNFDPDAFDGRGYLTTTADKSKALKFADASAAMKYYQQQSTVHPVRKSDGKPNRPLTAFTVTLENTKGQSLNASLWRNGE